MSFFDTHRNPLWLNAGLFSVAALVVWLAGSRLTRYADGVAAATGMGQVFAGMLLLGTVTSLPEIANVAASSAIGNPSLAVNNLLGSAAINVLLLALADGFVGDEAVTSAVAKPGTLLMSALCILLLLFVAIAIASTDVLVLGIGLWSAAICAASMAAFWLAARYDARAPWSVRDAGEGREEEGGDGEEGGPLGSLLTRGAIAAAVILVCGYVLSNTGDALAVQTGLGAGMVGFALLGLSTSLPELSTIVAALRLRRYDMAFGQVLGTNFVNLSLILLADAVFADGPVLNRLDRFEIVSALLGASLIGIFLVGLLERRNPTVLRMGYDSAAVIALFALGLVLLALVRQQ